MPFAHGLMAKAGSGHRSAAEAIAAALQELHDEQCLVEIVNPLDDACTPGFLRGSQAAHDETVRRMPDLSKRETEQRPPEVR